MDTTKIFNKSPWRAIASLCVPSLISILVMMLYNMADMYFVGWMGDVAAVAAVSLASPVFSIIMAISTMLGNGGCTKIAQALGRGDQDAVRRYTALCFWGCIVIGAVFGAACLLGLNPLLGFLGAAEDTWTATKGYVSILALGAPIMLLNHTLGSALRGEGAIKASLLGNLISTFANILLDPVFILVLGLGVGGAAAATVLGNALAVVYYLCYCKLGKSGCVVELSPRYATNLKEFGSILALGLPNAISTGLSGFTATFSNRLLVGYGTAAVAAMAAGSKVVMVVTMVQMGICMGVQPLLAYCYGSQNWQRLKGIVLRVLGLTVALGAALTLLFYAIRSTLVGLFLQDAEAAALAAQLAGLLILAGPIVGIYYLATNLLQATGAAMQASVASALRQGLLLLPLLYIMNALWGLNGIALAHIAADTAAVVITGIMAVLNYQNCICVSQQRCSRSSS